MQTQTSQFLVQFPKGTKVVQVDDFPPGTPRSCEGAMHITPCTKSITPQEAAHLTAKGIRFVKLGKVAPPPVPSAVAAAPAPTPTRRTHRDAPKEESGQQ